MNPLEEYEQYFNLPSGKSLINVGTDDAPVFELGTIYSVNAPENGYVSGDGSNYFKALMAPAGFRGTLYVAPESGYAFARGSRVVLKNADTGAVIAQSESEFASATDDAQSFSNVTMPSADVTVEANIVAKKPQLAAPEVKFSASATDATKATLSYADVAERTLQYTLDEGGNWTDLSDTSTELNDLAAGMKIWVQAYSKSGAAPASGIVKFNVGQAAAPSGVKLMGTDTDKGNLTGLQLGDTYQVNSGTTYTIASAAEGNNVVLTDGVKEVGSLSSGNVIHVTRAGSKDVVATVGGAAVNLKSAAYDITLTQATENPSVTVTQPTVKDGNGSISTSNAMEIKLNTPTSNENEAFHDWTKCTGATAVKPGSYDVRNAGGENMLAGTARTAVVVKNLAETPSLTIATTGADSATISDGTTSSSTALEWSVDGGTNWTDATLSSGTADISGLKAGDLMLRVKEDGDTLASAAQTIKLTQPAAPTTPAANSTNDGLTGVTDKMEYGTSTSYGNAVTTNATTVDGLIAGTNYYVRYKADGKNALASEPIIVHLHSADSSKVVITYDMNGYGTQIAPKEVQLTGEPAKFTLTASEAPATYTDGVPTDAVELSGWKIGETTVTADSTAITSDTTLVAQWTKENMTVTVTNPGNSDVIKVNNGSNNANLTTAKVGDTITLTAVPAANRFFKSWAVTKTSGADAVKVTGNTFVMPEFPVTVVGTFDAIARIYVTFDPNGGTLNGTSPRQTGVDGKLVASEIPSATQSGQVFSGWYTEKSGGTYVDKDTVFTGGTDVTVYAHWSTAGAGGSVSGGTTGGSTGGSSSGSTGTTTPGTTTSTNADGSTTTTTTAANGTVTETTTAADGSKTETVTRTDGSSTKTETTASGAEVKTETAADGSATVEGKDANGTTASAKTDTDGKLTEAKANVTAATVTAAVTAATAANEKPVVTLPVEVPAATSAETAASIVIDMPASVSAENPVKVEIPVEDVKTSTVVVIVKEDGTEEIVKDCTVTKDGVVLGVEGNVTVKVVDNTKTFSDSVPNWAADEVNFVTSREIFNGSDGQFNAEQTTSRAMIAQVLFNFDKESGNSTETGSFGDAAGKWFDEAASWASSLGVVNGDNGNFNGDAAVTRQDLATMLFRYATARGFDTSVKGGESSFSDASDVAGYAATAMQWAVENGIINGIDGALQPTGSATRAQVAAMMARFVKNVAN